jgi:hypothetical protein
MTPILPFVGTVRSRVACRQTVAAAGGPVSMRHCVRRTLGVEARCEEGMAVLEDTTWVLATPWTSSDLSVNCTNTTMCSGPALIKPAVGSTRTPTRRNASFYTALRLRGCNPRGSVGQNAANLSLRTQLLSACQMPSGT